MSRPSDGRRQIAIVSTSCRRNFRPCVRTFFGQFGYGSSYSIKNFPTSLMLSITRDGLRPLPEDIAPSEHSPGHHTSRRLAVEKIEQNIVQLHM